MILDTLYFYLIFYYKEILSASNNYLISSDSEHIIINNYQYNYNSSINKNSHLQENLDDVKLDLINEIIHSEFSDDISNKMNEITNTPQFLNSVTSPILFNKEQQISNCDWSQIKNFKPFNADFNPDQNKICSFTKEYRLDRLDSEYKLENGHKKYCDSSGNRLLLNDDSSLKEICFDLDFLNDGINTNPRDDFCSQDHEQENSIDCINTELNQSYSEVFNLKLDNCNNTYENESNENISFDIQYQIVNKNIASNEFNPLTDQADNKFEFIVSKDYNYYGSSVKPSSNHIESNKNDDFNDIKNVTVGNYEMSTNSHEIISDQRSIRSESKNRIFFDDNNPCKNLRSAKNINKNKRRTERYIIEILFDDNFDNSQYRENVSCADHSNSNTKRIKITSCSTCYMKERVLSSNDNKFIENESNFTDTKMNASVSTLQNEICHQKNKNKIKKKSSLSNKKQKVIKDLKPMKERILPNMKTKIQQKIINKNKKLKKSSVKKKIKKSKTTKKKTASNLNKIVKVVNPKKSKLLMKKIKLPAINEENKISKIYKFVKYLMRKEKIEICANWILLFIENNLLSVKVICNKKNCCNFEIKNRKNVIASLYIDKITKCEFYYKMELVLNTVKEIKNYNPSIDIYCLDFCEKSVSKKFEKYETFEKIMNLYANYAFNTELNNLISFLNLKFLEKKPFHEEFAYKIDPKYVEKTQSMFNIEKNKFYGASKYIFVLLLELNGRISLNSHKVDVLYIDIKLFHQYVFNSLIKLSEFYDLKDLFMSYFNKYIRIFDSIMVFSQFLHYNFGESGKKYDILNKFCEKNNCKTVLNEHKFYKQKLIVYCNKIDDFDDRESFIDLKNNIKQVINSLLHIINGKIQIHNILFLNCFTRNFSDRNKKYQKNIFINVKLLKYLLENNKYMEKTFEKVISIYSFDSSLMNIRIMNRLLMKESKSNFSRFEKFIFNRIENMFDLKMYESREIANEIINLYTFLNFFVELSITYQFKFLKSNGIFRI